MPSSTRLLEDFILPALDTAAFGHFLEWVDPEQKESFKVYYHHKNGRNWSKDSADVFVAWDKLKGRNPDSVDYFTKSRQRFRVALSKCPRLERVPSSGDKHVQIFKIISHKKRNPKTETFIPSQVPSNMKIKQELDQKLEPDIKPNIPVFSLPHNPVIVSSKALQRSPHTSVIVSTEDVLRQRKAFLEVALNAQTENVTHSSTELKGSDDKSPKVEDLEKSVSIDSSSEVNRDSNSNEVQKSLPLKIVHHMPVVPIPKQTSRIEVLRNKAKSFRPILPRDRNTFLPVTSIPDKTPNIFSKSALNVNTNMHPESEEIPTTMNNLSLLNIQRVQKQM